MKEKTINLRVINLYSIVFIIMVLVTIIAPYLFLLNDGADSVSLIHPIWFIVIFMIAVFIHELIHAVCFAKFAENGFKSVYLGIKWKMLAPYCHCSMAIKVYQFRIALLMPTIILGFLPTVIGFLINDFTFITFGCTMIVAGFGDLLGVWMLRKFDKNTLIKDHPEKMGFYYEDK